MKPHHRSLLIGIGLALGAVLFMGQSRAPIYEPGRYAMHPSPKGDGAFVVDTATGAVKFVYSGSPVNPSPYMGMPFDRLP